MLKLLQIALIFKSSLQDPVIITNVKPTDWTLFFQQNCSFWLLRNNAVSPFKFYLASCYFSAIPWLNFWHPSYKSIVPFTCCRKIPINTYLILFVGFRDVGNLQSVVDAMNLHWDTKRYFWQKCLFSRPFDLHREIKKDYALCSTRTKALKDSELKLAVTVSNLTFWLTRTSQTMMHQYKTLVTNVISSLLKECDLIPWWKLMHSKGISNAAAVKRIGEKTLSARKTVSQSRKCSFLKVTILNPFWHSA